MAQALTQTLFQSCADDPQAGPMQWGDLGERERTLMACLAGSEADLPPEHGPTARRLTRRLLAQLATDQQLVLTWLHLEQRSIEDISRLTGWSIWRVKWTAGRGRRRLRNLLARLRPG
ncbi:MAG: hypothetical protein FJ387_17310 [Verrucomicrobia bacterium]|nr:hypothetical protein [Verrucomicrobiota bacterium]